MVIDETTIESINTTLIVIQRRIDRIIQAMDKFTADIAQVQTLADVRNLRLKI
jgi:hypothetical protein